MESLSAVISVDFMGVGFSVLAGVFEKTGGWTWFFDD
jgi:hypothetical protein